MDLFKSKGYDLKGYALPAVTILLLLALIGSLAVNRYLFMTAKEYYTQMNEVRLDPLGLSQYPPQTLEAVEGLQRVVFFGDSRAQNWPSPHISGYEFVNRGIGAQTSTQIAGRFEAHVVPLKPDILIVQMGINDLKTIPLFPDQRDNIIANCLTNIHKIIDEATAIGARVIVTTVFPVGEPSLERRLFAWSDEIAESVGEVNDSLRAIASDNVLVLDAFVLLVGETGLINPDYALDALHLNSQGYAKLNIALTELLKAES